MFLKLPYEAFRKGEIHGIKITRNPIAWIPYFLSLPFIFLGMVLFYVFIYPPILILMFCGITSLSKKEIDFDETGITFRKAYGKRKMKWSEIDSIEWVREPTVAYYKIQSNCGNTKPFIAIEFERRAHFEDLIKANGIMLKKSDPLNFEKMNRNANKSSEDNSE